MLASTVAILGSSNIGRLLDVLIVVAAAAIAYRFPRALPYVAVFGVAFQSNLTHFVTSDGDVLVGLTLGSIALRVRSLSWPPWPRLTATLVVLAALNLVVLVSCLANLSGPNGHQIALNSAYFISRSVLAAGVVVLSDTDNDWSYRWGQALGYLAVAVSVFRLAEVVGVPLKPVTDLLRVSVLGEYTDPTNASVFVVVVAVGIPFLIVRAWDERATRPSVYWLGWLAAALATFAIASAQSRTGLAIIGVALLVLAVFAKRARRRVLVAALAAVYVIGSFVPAFAIAQKPIVVEGTTIAPTTVATDGPPVVAPPATLTGGGSQPPTVPRAILPPLSPQWRSVLDSSQYRLQQTIPPAAEEGRGHYLAFVGAVAGGASGIVLQISVNGKLVAQLRPSDMDPYYRWYEVPIPDSVVTAGAPETVQFAASGNVGEPSNYFLIGGLYAHSAGYTDRFWTGDAWLTDDLSPDAGVQAGLLVVFIDGIVPSLTPFDSPKGALIDPSLGDRLTLWQSALNASLHHPLFGTGFYTFGLIKGQYIPAGSHLFFSYANAHSNYFELLSDIGWAGPILFLLLFLLPLSRFLLELWTSRRGDWLLAAYALALGAFLISSLTETWVADSRLYVLAWFVALVAAATLRGSLRGAALLRVSTLPAPPATVPGSRGAARASTGGQPSQTTPPPAAIESHDYRPALDGLRAIAVTGVVLYHLGYGWMRGGFLGVDVFFVLSGYLITSILIAASDRQGINAASFWARRARRLLPAALLLCVVTAALIHWLQPTPTWALRQADLLWTIFYGMNWHLIATDQSYFAQYLGASPLRHAWSLAIEEQFYAVWPLALILLLRVLRLTRLHLAVTIVVAALASGVTLALLFDPGAPSRAYYGTDSRAHELLVGALLCLCVRWRPPERLMRGRTVDLLGLGCVAALAMALVLVPDTWPGYYLGGSLLLSVLVAVLIWTVEMSPHSLLALTLGAAPLRWLGKISYGLYLWHWPAILFGTAAIAALFGSRLAMPMSNPVGADLTRIALTVGIATVSYYIVEQPIRRGRLGPLKLTNRWVLGVAPVAMLGTAAISIALTTVPPVTALAIVPGEYQCADANALICTRHVATSPARPVVAVVGDSTARSLDAGFIDLAQKYDWTYIGAARGGCSIIDRVALLGANNEPAPGNAICPHNNALIRQQLLDVYRPDLYIDMENFFQIDALDDAGNRLVAGTPAHLADTERRLEQVADELTSRGAMLVFIQNLPLQLPIDCQPASANPACAERASSDKITAMYAALQERVAARHPQSMRVVSLQDLLCPHDQCISKIDGVLLRYDRIHFTKAAAHWLAPYLYERLSAVGAVPISVNQTRA